MSPAYIETDELSREWGYMARVNALQEMGFDFSDPDCSILRTKLWKDLGYGKALLSFQKIENMWQRNLEIETVGWPVVPSTDFFQPNSTTAKLVERLAWVKR
jgi:hypothetical protein